jgi:hypothetical protein
MGKFWPGWITLGLVAMIGIVAFGTLVGLW